MLLYRAVQPHPAQPAQPAVRPVEVLLPTELGDDVYRLVDGQFTVVLGDDALHPDDAKPSDLSAPPPSPPRPLPSADTLSWALPEFHGYPEQVQQLHRLLHDFVYEAALYRRHHQRPLAGALLHGPSGIGKTLLAHDLLSASFPQTPVVRIHAASWLAKGPSEIMNHLTNLYTRGAPTSDPRLPAQIVVIDGIDLFCGNRRQMDAAQGGAAHPQLIQMMLTLLDGMHQKSAPASHALRTFTLAICQKPEMLDDALRRPGRFDIEIELNVPTPQDRAAILAHHVQTLLGPSDDAGSSGEETASAWRADVAEMAKRAHGFIGADLAAVAAEARRSLESSVDETASSPPDATVAAAPWPQAAAALRRALKRIRPSALRDISLEIPEVHWSDIGGLEDIKQRFHEAVTWPMAHPEAFQRMRLQPTKGILLYGPPGCSKTLLAKALATEAGLNFLVVKGPELFSKWVGESEKAVQQLFARARAASPAIIFFDEIDAIATARAGGDGGGGVHDRVLSQLLTEMDGIETLSRVLVVAATNRPDRLDAALLRPGRIDRMLYVGLPEPAARSAIFRIACKRMAVTADIDWSRLTDQTEGYTGAEIVALCHEAAMEALRAGAMAVAALHFEGALSRVLPRTTPEMLAFFERFQAGL
ncbi:hypothetical protein CXG81DRAFT_9523 [Caulochytrium protostelioides]|uniref:AAA-domain-containing protein n=1 Tax=Caulochytrium protostelioides TaxID=1555241 RepID=A0A4P9WTA9_9FUNG|nr:AAA-domain-containing protein [Caulochytrium protostelioides]RKP03405.1 hypothetical protein CXG81DRAFT_9523 [Caulochytrium protostelioides]|eukprot:RKP03405.1 hypothetical protein CXG81DRAFT_9523 [Caulochytrium protostelioides]